jgi:hypothetical protein
MLLSFFCIENKVKNKNYHTVILSELFKNYHTVILSELFKNYHTVILSELFQNLIKNRRNSSKIPTHMCDR